MNNFGFKKTSVAEYRHWAATLLVGGLALLLTAERFIPANETENRDGASIRSFMTRFVQNWRRSYPPNLNHTLHQLSRRAGWLRKITDPVKRDSFCIPASANARALDRTLAKDARVFLAGMLGRTNVASLGFYYPLRNYLFPRDVEISLDGKAVIRGFYFEGVPCDSPAELQARGFDLLITFGTNWQLQLIPLTQKGVPQ